jgi:hypothetical protein
MNRRDRSDGDLKQSNSAFYHTTSSEIGAQILSLEEKTETKTCTTSSSALQSFPFLYTRESDKIGAMVPGNGMSSKSQTASDLARRRAARNSMIEAEIKEQSNLKPVKISAEQILSCYKQGTKIEDPRFTTSSNEYGKTGGGSSYRSKISSINLKHSLTELANCN